MLGGIGRHGEDKKKTKNLPLTVSYRMLLMHANKRQTSTRGTQVGKANDPVLM